MGEARRAADAASDAARRARREVEAGVERARREAAKVGADLAAVNQFLRSHVGAPGGRGARRRPAGGPGYEFALAAALGPGCAPLWPRTSPRSVRCSIARARTGAPRWRPAPRRRSAPPRPAPRRWSSSPAPGAEPLLSRVRPEGDGPRRRSPSGCWPTSGSWTLDGLRPDFRGVAVTRSGRVWSPLTRELRQVPGGGEDRLLAERNRRDELVQAAERAAQAEHAAIAEGERASQAVAAADAARDEADRAARTAARARDEASEAVRHAGWLLDQRRRAPDEGPTATRRAQLGAALAAERRLAERAERERRDRERRLTLERARLEADDRLAPVAQRLVAALAAAGEAVGARQAALQAELDADRAAGERLAADLRAGAAAENAAQTRLHGSAEAVTRAEVRAPAGARPRAGGRRRPLRARGQARPRPRARRRPAARGRARRARRADRAPAAPPRAARPGQPARPGRVRRGDRPRRGARGPPRGPRGRAARAQGPDPRHRHPHPRGVRGDVHRGRQELRGGRRAALPGRPRPPAPRPRGRRPAPGARRRRARGVSPSDEERLEQIAESEESGDPDDGMGVEIEITPAGKSTKRLTLLSGGEKSLTALAFLFAVFLARPCPFYILDEVEAALDDLNIDRFLGSCAASPTARSSSS